MVRNEAARKDEQVLFRLYSPLANKRSQTHSRKGASWLMARDARGVCTCGGSVRQALCPNNYNNTGSALA